MDAGSSAGSEARFAAYVEALGLCWVMPIDSSRCMITAWGC